MSTVKKLAKDYMKSHQYLSLKATTCDVYENHIKFALRTRIKNGKQLGNYTLDEVNVAALAIAYKEWLNNGIYKANETARIMSIVFNYGVALDLMRSNPIAYVKKVKPKARKTMWKKEEVEKFLDVAYSKFEYRNIGLIVHMAYDWCQRPNDIRLLKFESLDLPAEKVYITQTKRGATVELPIYEPLLGLLRQQKEEWDFQEYVVPRVRPSDGAYAPYDRATLNTLYRKCRDEAGLDKDLRLSDLRRTGITEMVEAGVDATSIMSVSGHASVSSLDPYIKHTYKTAKGALDARKKG